jgi:hypothetical protein
MGPAAFDLGRRLGLGGVPTLLPPEVGLAPVFQLGPSTALTGIPKSGDGLTAQGLDLRMNWTFHEPRGAFPWMFLKLTPRERGNVIIIPKAVCAPEAAAGPYQENWHFTASRVREGRYGVEALFVDNAKRIWATRSAQRYTQTPSLTPAIPLGDLNVTARKDLSRN